MTNCKRYSSILLIAAVGLTLMPLSSLAAAKPVPAKPAVIVKELTDSRSAYSKTYLYSDGSYEAVLYAKPIHAPDGAGNWQEIHPAWQAEADGTGYQSIGAPYEAELPQAYEQGYGLGQGADMRSFLPVDAAPSQGILSAGNAVRYADAWPDTDSTFTLTDRGLIETLTLRSDAAPGTFVYETSGESGEGAAELPAALLQDAQGQVQAVPQTVRRDDGKIYVDLTPDLTGLVYPISIRRAVEIRTEPAPPAAELSVAGAAYGAPDNGGGAQLAIGHVGDTAAYAHLQFDLSVVPAKAALRDAYLSLNVTDAGTGGTAAIQALRHAQAWSPAGPDGADAPESLIPLDARGAAYGSLSVNSPGLKRLPLAGLAAEWLTAAQPNFGLALGSDSPGLLTIASSDDPDAALRPQLHIRYETADGKLKRSLQALTGLQLFTYTYDAQNRLQTIQMPGGHIQFTYDYNGNLTRREFIPDAAALSEETGQE
ncbi:DNRLRE domain-containing protein [Cohnella sp. 56]|uniref:DNRLRE domain-containing protein n=1 Tax=Cohnella sp. 56 TaxID=3113722 RepID=UPI0030EA93A4